MKQVTMNTFFAAMLFFSSNALWAQSNSPELSAMTQEKLVNIVEEMAGASERAEGAVLFSYNEISMALLSDTNYDRMRIIAPIVKQEELTEEELYAILDANYHSALDARYATSEGVLYATFIHPLSPLTRNQVESALRQVSALVQTFGSTYTSGELMYGDGAQQSEQYKEL